jgi:hypothetical protein
VSHFPGIVPAITLTILRRTAPVNDRFSGLPNRGPIKAAGDDSSVALVKPHN